MKKTVCLFLVFFAGRLLSPAFLAGDGEDHARAVIAHWAGRTLPAWRGQGAKIAGPRIVLARLAAGRGVAGANRYLLGAWPWSGVGSSWDLRELFGRAWNYDDRLRAGHRGDYDFSLVTLTTVLYLFGDREERLYPETRAHLVEALLTVEGGRPRTRVPYSLGLVRETENHVLMTESSRYLKNQWRRRQGGTDARFDNRRNGLEAWLIAWLDHLLREGFHEFSSIPYEGYTVQALLNLEAFAAAPAVATRARRLLDRLAGHYALGSLDFRRAVPFRRQLRHLGLSALRRDPLGAFMSVWAGAAPATFCHQALIAAILPYRPPATTLALARKKKASYFARLGHGRQGSPAIFSGGPGYLLSAGGAGRGLAARVVPRPTVLLLSDGAVSIDDCFHLPGRGHPLRWNNTGVYRRLAVGNAGVRVPAGRLPVAVSGRWSLYESGSDGLGVAVYGREDFGLLKIVALPAGACPRETLAPLMAANPCEERLGTLFQRPGGGSVGYEPGARPGTWVISSVDGRTVGRAYDRWPPDSSLKPTP